MQPTETTATDAAAPATPARKATPGAFGRPRNYRPPVKLARHRARAA